MLHRASYLATAPISPHRPESHDGLIANDVGVTVPPEQTLQQPPEQRPVYKVVFHQDAKNPSSRDRISIFSFASIWCASSALFALKLNRLLQSFPYPLCIATFVLGTQFSYSLAKWFLFRTRRPPSFSRIRRRHWYRLVLAAFAHGMGTIAFHYTAQFGPMTTCVLLKLLPYPFLLSSLPIWLAIAASITNIFQLVLGLIANLCFAARSRVRISTHRFQGSQNVFDVTCALSFLFVALPLSLVVEGKAASIFLQDQDHFADVAWSLPFLGILYSVSNDMGAIVPQYDLTRRIVTWVSAALVLGEARRYQDILGAIVVFAGRWWSHRHQPRGTNASRKQQDIFPTVANRGRTFSADSCTTQGSMWTSGTSLRSIRSVGSFRADTPI